MRMVFGVLGLLIVVAIVGVLAKKQMQPAASKPVTVGVDSAAQAVSVTPALPKQAGASVEAMMQQPRSLPDDK